MRKHIIILLLIGIFTFYTGLKYKQYVVDYDYSKTKTVYTPEEKEKNVEYEAVDIFIPNSEMKKLVRERVKILHTEILNEKIRLIYNKILENSEEAYDIINKDIKKIPDAESTVKREENIIFINKVKLLDVFIQKDRVYLNFDSKLIDNSSSAEHELLVIYSIVNSITSISGIKKVKILINNKSIKSLKFYNITGFFERDTSI